MMIIIEIDIVESPPNISEISIHGKLALNDLNVIKPYSIQFGDNTSRYNSYKRTKRN